MSSNNSRPIIRALYSAWLFKYWNAKNAKETWQPWGEIKTILALVPYLALNPSTKIPRA